MIVLIQFTEGEGCDACPAYENDEQIRCRIFNKDMTGTCLQRPVPRLPECIAKYGKGEPNHGG